MDLNIYLIEYWAKERLSEVRAAATRERLVESLQPRPPFRVALGLALIRLGQRLQGAHPTAPSSLATRPQAGWFGAAAFERRLWRCPSDGRR
ncbi:MAG: hypothetical protein DMD96_26400 [Candidatus Rokuibacteriota bacterium]|nr:MAG: hypothetical protein DMD96_26400 [Candidatus Rokubacteria bacterium]